MPAFREMLLGESLDHFHERCVVPTPLETASRSAEIDAFVRFLQARFNTHQYSTARVLKNGSLGKGTAVRGSADIDLVVVLNGLASIEDLKAQRPALLSRLDQEVRSYPWQGRIVGDGNTQFSVQYVLNDQKLDVLPALDYVRVYGSKEAVYLRMARGPDRGRGVGQQFSASLGPLQVDFVKLQGESVKRVIRLLKYWKKENRLNIKSYTLELLTIHASLTRHWQQDTKILFQTVLTMLADCRSIRVAFNNYYHSAPYTEGLTPPYVLDPANPYMNTIYGVDANTISHQARIMLGRL